MWMALCCFVFLPPLHIDHHHHHEQQLFMDDSLNSKKQTFFSAEVNVKIYRNEPNKKQERDTKKN